MMPASLSTSSLQERVTMAVETDILTLDEAAEYLRVHPRTLRVKASEGQIPGAKIGRVWRFHRQQLESWLLQGGVLSPPLEVD